MPSTNKNTFAERRIAITGASGGLGRELALCFARNGWRVAVADVREAEGEAVVGELKTLGAEAFYQHCDVRQESDFETLLAACQQHWGGVDVLVNNAGVASAGRIEKEPIDNWLRLLDINTLGVVRGCKVFAPALKAQGGGQLVNIASIAGIASVPKMSSYNASKAAVVSLSETLRAELSPDGIGVTVVCPHLFRTGLLDSMVNNNDRTKAGIGKTMDASPLSAADIAQMIYRAVHKNTFMLLPHRATHWVWWLKRLSPSLDRWLSARLA
ncbi:SDR family oxidoreductase [Microbulbifer agarilyticus]|uniref:SDR family oxidoreductase n=1 Tax=Microbulbifer agarilyticus TaxID=260552 RepID=UPI001C94B3AB|nr:SDR family oxidoreductase [Microbulbifer agarilyticus]MBY6211707.1 SDR family oxidoreductase [Microbulbifer agarilyticus]